MGSVNHCTVGRIAEGVINRWHVRTAPASWNVRLQDLLRDKVPVNRNLIVEGVVHADNFFLHVGGRIRTANKGIATGRGRENSSLQEALRVGIQQSRIDYVLLAVIDKRSVQRAVGGSIRCNR